MPKWNNKYDTLDWTKSNRELSIEMSVGVRAIARARKRRGISKAKLLDGAGHSSPPNRYTLWQSSPVTKPINDLDYEFAKKNSKTGRGGGHAWHKAVIRACGYACSLCSYYKPPVANHCHHKIPLSQGGKNTIRNGIVLCSRCHLEVHAGLLELEDQ